MVLAAVIVSRAQSSSIRWLVDHRHNGAISIVIAGIAALLLSS